MDRLEIKAIGGDGKLNEFEHAAKWQPSQASDFRSFIGLEDEQGIIWGNFKTKNEPFLRTDHLSMEEWESGMWEPVKYRYVLLDEEKIHREDMEACRARHDRLQS